MKLFRYAAREAPHQFCLVAAREGRPSESCAITRRRWGGEGEGGGRPSLGASAKNHFSNMLYLLKITPSTVRLYKTL